MESIQRGPAYVQKWKRVMAIGCTHGDLAQLDIQQDVLDFKERFKPEVRFDLGDIVDTAAFRSGAKGTSDEGKEIEPDEFAAITWLKRYEPTHISWGNHDWRLIEMQNSPNALVAYAAKKLWGSLRDTVSSLKSETVEYDYEHGWFEMGGTFWGHGYWYAETCVRDHAEYLGGPVVMAHKHVAEEEQGRTRRPSKSFCVGLLGDPQKMAYARRRRATARWSHGAVWGEVSDKSSCLWLSSCRPGERLRFPI